MPNKTCEAVGPEKQLAGPVTHLIMAWRAKRSHAPMLKMPVLSMDRLRTNANLLTVRLLLIGTVLTNVVKLSPFPKVKEMMLVLGNKA